MKEITELRPVLMASEPQCDHCDTAGIESVATRVFEEAPPCTHPNEYPEIMLCGECADAVSDLIES